MFKVKQYYKVVTWEPGEGSGQIRTCVPAVTSRLRLAAVGHIQNDAGRRGGRESEVP